MNKRSFAVLTLAMLSTSFPAMATIYKCPTPSGVFEYTSIPCANGFRKEGEQWIDIAAERKQRIAAAEARKMRSENENKPQITSEETSSATLPNPSKPENSASTSNSSSFRCDGRTHCSQMTSCDEAKYFLKNCPNVKMDGGKRDGVPCEQQWCH
jgi:hypothetical protein